MMTERNRTISLIGGLVLLFLIVAVLLYAFLVDRPLDNFLPILLAVAAPSVASLLASAGVKTDIDKVRGDLGKVHKQVNGNYSRLTRENEELRASLVELASAQDPHRPAPARGGLPPYHGPTTTDPSGRHRL